MLQNPVPFLLKTLGRAPTNEPVQQVCLPSAALHTVLPKASGIPASLADAFPVCCVAIGINRRSPFAYTAARTRLPPIAVL